MSQCTITQLAALTGKTWRTIRSRLQAAGLPPIARDGRSELFDSIAALGVLYDIERLKTSELDLQAERAALARAQRMKLETDAALRSGKLLDADVVVEELSHYIADCRARLLAIPTKMAPTLAHITDVNIIAGHLKSEVYSALDQLANYGLDAGAQKNE